MFLNGSNLMPFNNIFLHNMGDMFISTKREVETAWFQIFWFVDP